MGMSINQARNFYVKNRDKFPGMSMTAAVDQMVRGGEIPVAAVEAVPVSAPTAVPAAPTAVPVAAAAPVPMAPPVDVVEAETAPTPAPAPKYMNQYENALAAFNLSNPQTTAPAPVKGKPVDYAAMAREAVKDSQRQELEANVEIARTAKIDPDMQKVIDDRLARYGNQLTEADKDRKQATWMAVAQAGMKMAQSQSPYFMQALASGMEAGIEGYSEAKAKAAEKKARLQDAKEELSMKAIELRAQAVKDALAVRLAAKQGAAADTSLRKDALAGLVAEQTAGDVIESADLGNQLTRANIANVYSTIGERAAAGRRAERAARSGGPSGGINLKNAGQIVNSLVSENKTYAAILENPMSSKAEKTQARSRMQENTQTIDYVRSLQKQNLGMGSGFKLLGPA